MAVKPRTFETQTLAQRLSQFVRQGDESVVLTYDELAKVAGRKVDDPQLRGYLDSARNIVERETNRNLVVERGKGLRLATLEDESSIGRAAATHIKRTANKSLKRMGNARYLEMTDSQKTTHNVSAAQLGAMVLMTKAKSVERLQGAVTQHGGKIDPHETLRLFGSNDTH